VDEAINNALWRYMKSPEGEAELNLDASFYSEEEQIAMAHELLTMILMGYAAQVQVGDKEYEAGTVRVSRKAVSGTGGSQVNLTFSPAGLYRTSLYTGKGIGYKVDTTKLWGSEKFKRDGVVDTYSGKGVNDIIGLFVNGYSAKKAAYGEWISSNENFSGIRSKTHRVGSNFVMEAVTAFEGMYPGVTVTVPKEWGGTSLV
jgi:hypothetical protein